MDNTSMPGPTPTPTTPVRRAFLIGLAIGALAGHQARHLLQALPAGCGTLDAKEVHWDGRQPKATQTTTIEPPPATPAK